MEQTNNRTIAKNTLLLYGRALLMMLIGLYTSRVILQILGVSDFGIYNAVGGIVAMFGFLSASLGNATSRFITIAIGKNDRQEINKTFGNIKVIYYGLSLLVLVLSETIGLWFLYHKMTIPAERMDAAFWVYQYSIFSTIIALICVPYNSAIIAHERMSAFAYISLSDAVLKLLACYLLLVIPHDKLVVYATLLFLIEIIDRMIYTVYCNRRFEEVHAPAQINKKQFREIISMSAWTLSGNFAWVLNTMGINLLLNMFFGPIVNAARGIALQVQGVMSQFVTNFQTALNPQITKNYGQGNLPRLHDLLHLSSKYSYYLMLTMSIPVFIEAPIILKWWLHTVPDNTVIYLRIILIYSVLCTLSNPLWIAVLATGKLKKYQLYDNLLQLSVVPIAYLAFKLLNAESYWVFLILLFSEVAAIGIRVWIVLPLIEHPLSNYLFKVVLPLCLVTCCAPLLPMALYRQFGDRMPGVVGICVLSVVSTLAFIFIVGMNRQERDYVKNAVLAKWFKK